MKKILLLSIVLAACATAPRPLTTQTVLDRWAAALGGRERLVRITSVYRETAIKTGGVTGQSKNWSMIDGRMRNDRELAGVSDIETFDGRSGWTVDSGAAPHRLGGADLERAVNDAYVSSFSQFFPGRMAGTVELVGGGEPYVTLLIRPAGGREMRILIDPATWLPHARLQRSQERTATTTFLSWMDVDGVRFPKDVRRAFGDPRFDIELTTTSIKLNVPAERALFEKPADNAVIHFPDGSHEVAVPMHLLANHIHLPVSVNGSTPLEFLLDSGADSSVVETGRAKALGLRMAGALEARGSGPDSVETGIIKNATLSFGGLEMPVPAISAIPLGSLPLREGAPMDGILGYDITSHFVIEIDYEHDVIHFIDPATFQPDPADVPLPFSFNSNLPITRVKVTSRDGQTYDARLLVDTGARMAVDLSRPFLDRTKLTAGPAIEGPLGAGVGGATTQMIGRLAKIELAGFTLDAPVTSFSTATSGSELDPDVDGLIGGDLLKHFTFTIDYPHERLLLRPNAAFGSPFEYDMSGALVMSKDAKFDRIVISNVIAGSPAAEAGLMKGDELLSIDGKPAAELRLEDVKVMFRQPEKSYTLRLMRDGKEIVTTMKTRRLV